MSKSLVKKSVALKNARLRVQAGLAYVGHAQGVSLEDLSKDSRFSAVSLRTLERWCKADKWVEQRQSFISNWQEMARKRLAGQLAQARIDELDLLEEIQDAGLAKIRQDAVAPKSLEGVMKATIEALKYKDELREKIGADVIDKTVEGATGLPAELPPDLTEVEAAEAARAVLAVKRTRMRAEIKALQDGKQPGGLTEAKPDAPAPPAGVVQEDHAELRNKIDPAPSDVRPASPEGLQRSDQDDRLHGPMRPPESGGAGRGSARGEEQDAVADVDAQQIPEPGR